MAKKKPYEGKAEMFTVPPLCELLNMPVFDAKTNKARTALHHLLDEKRSK